MMVYGISKGIQASARPMPKMVQRGLASAAGGSGFEDDRIPRMMSGPQREMIKKATLDASAFGANQKSMADRIFYAVPAQSESEIRSDLKTAHRLVAHYGWDDLTWNHISSRCGGEEDEEDCCDLDSSTYLITPGGMHFSEVREYDFVFDSIQESGNVIHSGIYAARPDVRCIIHIHTPAIMAMSCIEEPFRFLVQDAAIFYNRIGYHMYEGMHSTDEEKESIARNLGKDGIALIMQNHGATIVGRSIQEAFVRTYYLDRCCRVQLDAMATGSKLIECSPDLLQHAQQQMETIIPSGRYEWSALKRLVDR